MDRAALIPLLIASVCLVQTPGKTGWFLVESEGKNGQPSFYLWSPEHQSSSFPGNKKAVIQNSHRIRHNPKSVHRSHKVEKISSDAAPGTSSDQTLTFCQMRKRNKLLRKKVMLWTTAETTTRAASAEPTQSSTSILTDGATKLKSEDMTTLANYDVVLHENSTSVTKHPSSEDYSAQRKSDHHTADSVANQSETSNKTSQETTTARLFRNLKISHVIHSAAASQEDNATKDDKEAAVVKEDNIVKGGNIIKEVINVIKETSRDSNSVKESNQNQLTRQISGTEITSTLVQTNLNHTGSQGPTQHEVDEWEKEYVPDRIIHEVDRGKVTLKAQEKTTAKSEIKPPWTSPYTQATQQVTTQSVTAQPVTAQPVTVQQVTTQPVTTEHLLSEPVTTQPVSTLSEIIQPVSQQPVTTQSVTIPTLTTQPVTIQPAPTQAVATQPVTTQSVTMPPVTTQLLITQPVPPQPATSLQPMRAEPAPAQPETTQPGHQVITLPDSTTQPQPATKTKIMQEIRESEYESRAILETQV